MLLSPAGGHADPPRPAWPAPLAERSLLLDVTRAGPRLVAVGERGHVLLSDDDGRTWRQVPVPVRALLTAAHFPTPDVGFAVGHDAVVLRTRDGGQRWEIVHRAPEQQIPLLSVRFLDERRGLAVGAYGFALATDDGGERWARVRIDDADLHLNHLAVDDLGRLYLAAEAGIAYRSDDGGRTWQMLDAPYEGSFFGVLPLGGERVLLYGLRGHLLRSEDAGATWLAVPTGVASLLGAGIARGGKVLIGGLAGTLLRSRDGGRSFEPLPLPDRQGISGLAMASDGTVVVAGEAGVGRLEAPDLGPTR
jgi:photosystem II stability/assembly factor-like uncharacterized protein